jgi:hypothetical protein
MDEMRAFEAWLGSEPAERVRVLAHDYARDTDWSFPDAPEVDAADFEAILRSAAGGVVELSAVDADRGTLVVALAYVSGAPRRDTSVWVSWHNTLDPHYPRRLEMLGVAVLTTRRVPGPPSPPFRVGEAYPLAFDICGEIAAVSFAALDVYSDIDRGWWCMVEQFRRRDGHWHPAGGSHDNTTTATPFARPIAGDWIEWGSDGGHGIWDEEPRERHSYFGIAPTQVARLSVRTRDSRERDVAITPWSGAWVVVGTGTTSTLTGRVADDAIVGEMAFGSP